MSKDYTNAVIYELRCKLPTIKKTYIGSTTNLKQRICRHKSACNNPNGKVYHLPVYKYIRENGGWTMWECVVVECCAVETKYE